MSNTMNLPSYKTLAEALDKTQSSFDAAQVHGLICGLIAITPEKKDYDWNSLVLGPKQNKTSFQTLEDIHESTYHQLSDFSFEFTLLLPNDDLDINIRTEALGLWCQGFIIGLQHFENFQDQNLSEDASNSLNDLIEIAKVDYGDIEDTEEDETAYFELVEYVRLAALLIYQELRSNQTIEDSDENISL